jgi:outer membrane protein assembly factor BamE
MRKLIPVLLLFGGCSQVPMLPGLTPHKIDIQQGNYITQDLVAKLKPGMTKSQVRFVLGTPLVVDPFHTDRWDYVYVLNKKGRQVEHRRIVAVFRGDSLVRIEGDVVPAKDASAEKTADAARPADAGKPAATSKPADAAPGATQ